MAFKIQQELGLTMVDKSEIENGSMKKSVPVDPSCHPKNPRARVQPTKSCHDLAGYYGFKDLQKNEFKSPIKGFGNNSEGKI